LQERIEIERGVENIRHLDQQGLNVHSRRSSVNCG
jgi:hypothetical protein